MPDLFIHIGEMLSRNARMYPDDVAMVERIPAENRRREITWKQFDEDASRFANRLLEKGIRKGDRVVQLMMNSIDWLVAYFGIIRTGAWVVPLNFRFTGADIKYCIDVAEPKLVLFGEEFTARIQQIRDQVQVKDFIFSGKALPEFAESFRQLKVRRQHRRGWNSAPMIRAPCTLPPGPPDNPSPSCSPTKTWNAPA